MIPPVTDYPCFVIDETDQDNRSVKKLNTSDIMTMKLFQWYFLIFANNRWQVSLSAGLM